MGASDNTNAEIGGFVFPSRKVYINIVSFGYTRTAAVERKETPNRKQTLQYTQKRSFLP